MNKKIGILTQPLGNNYGGIIQNYALQKVLKDLGNSPITINRYFNQQHSDLKIFLSRTKEFLFKHLLGKDLMTYWELEQTKKHTYEFINQHIFISPVIRSNESLISYFNNEQFDIIIVGSDQTWRPIFSPNIYNYFLDFLYGNNTIKKIAYASSFGTSDWEYNEEQTKKAAELVKQFNAVSVREDSGIDLCKQYLNSKAVHVLDPSMLLKVENYNQLIKKPNENRGLFTYVLDKSPETQKFITNSANLLGLKKYTVEREFDFNRKKKVADFIKPPIEEWLSCFRDADFVITDSFHGTAFSILYQKPFISIVNKSRGASRFESILKQFGLESRLIYDICDFNYDVLSEKINYSVVNQRLEELRAESMKFLINNLNQ